MAETIIQDSEEARRGIARMIEDLCAHPDRYTTAEYENVLKNGERVWISWTNRAIMDAGGRVTEVLCVGNDISGRKNAEEVLKYQFGFNQQILDSIPSPVYYKDIHERYLGCNRAFEQTIGRRRDEIIGRTAADILGPKLAASYHEKDIELFHAGGVQTYEGTMINAQGDNREVIFTKTLFTDEAGKTGGLIGVAVDITKRRHAERELARSEELLKRTLQMLSAGVMLIDAKTHVIVDVNPAALRMIGLPREQVVGAVCHRFFKADKEGECPITDLGQKEDYAERTLTKGATGEQIPVFKTAAHVQIRDRDYILESFIDLTARKVAEEERVHNEKMETLLELAGAASHELNQPLQIITGYAGMILKEHGELPDQMRSDLKEIQEQVRRMAGILWKLGHITRYETAEYTGEVNIIDIDKSSGQG